MAGDVSSPAPSAETPARPLLMLGQMPLRYTLPGLLLSFGLALILFQLIFLLRVDTQRATEATLNRCERSGERVARFLTKDLESREQNREPHDIRVEVNHLQAEKGVKLAMLVDENKMIQHARDESLIGKELSAVLPEAVTNAVREVLSGGRRQILNPEDASEVTGVFPLTRADMPLPLHVLVLQLDLQGPLHEARHLAAQQAMLSGLALLISCGLLWLVLDRVITKRVTRILTETRAIGSGDQMSRPLEGSDELAQIDKALRETHAIINRQAEGLRSQEKRYRLMVESLPAMVYIARESGIEYINDTGLKMLGLRGRDEIIGRSPFDFIHPDFHDAVRERTKEVLRTGASAPPLEEQIVRKDGTVVSVETVASMFTDVKGEALQVVMHDITERKAAEARREALGREITNTSEREQRRIGQDLHDDICQRLAAVKMSMQDLEESLAEHAPALMDDADAIVDRLTDTIRITRTLARGLSPVEMEAGGLSVALAGLVRSSRELLGIECELEMPDELPPLSTQVATQFYRIAQECITNAAKHGQAPVVRVSIAEKDSDLVLRVSNNGRPFPPAAKDSQGMGLHIMRHRAESMGARLDFELQPYDASFAVRCELPIQAITTTEPS